MAFDDAVLVVVGKVYIQWDVDWVEETDWLLLEGFRVERALVDPLRSLARLGQSPTGSATVRVDNRDGRYSTTKAGSPAATYGIYNKPVRVEAGYYDPSSGEVVARIFSGRIAGIRGGEVEGEATLTCRDGAGDFERQLVSTQMEHNVETRDWITTLLEEAGYTPGAGEIEYSHGVIPFAYADRDNAWQEVLSAAASEGGSVFADLNGVVRFWPYTHWLGESEEHAWGVSLYQELQADYDHYNTFNVVSVEYEPRQVSRESVVYNLRRTISIPVGETKTETLVLSKPLDQFTGYEMLAVTGGGEDITGDVTLDSVEPTSAQSWTITFTNANTRHGAFITKFTVSGRALEGRPSETYTSDPDDLAGTTEARELALGGNWYIQTEEQAELLGELTRQRLSESPLVLHIQGMPFDPDLELGQKITVTSGSGMAINTTGVAIRIQVRGLLPLLMDVDVAGYERFYGFPDDEFFIIGTSHLSTVDGGRCVY